MSGEPEEPTRDALLDATPEAVAMRRARAARAEAAARHAAAEAAAPPAPRRIGRRLVLGGAIAGVAGVRLLSALAARRGGGP